MQPVISIAMLHIARTFFIRKHNVRQAFLEWGVNPSGQGIGQGSGHRARVSPCKRAERLDEETRTRELQRAHLSNVSRAVNIFRTANDRNKIGSAYCTPARTDRPQTRVEASSTNAKAICRSSCLALCLRAAKALRARHQFPDIILQVSGTIRATFLKMRQRSQTPDSNPGCRAFSGKEVYRAAACLENGLFLR